MIPTFRIQLGTLNGQIKPINNSVPGMYSLFFFFFFTEKQTPMTF